MKAFLLGAGVGSRLRPFTEKHPKCLVPINGKPLLKIWFESLARSGVSQVMLNTHHHADQVVDFVQRDKTPGLKVALFNEPVLLGSAGTVAANRNFIGKDKEFLVIYADNLTDLNLSDFIHFHQTKNSPFSMALFTTPVPKSCGIALMDENDLVVDFVEKPENPKGPWANAGLYLANRDLFDLIPDKRPCDFGFDILPQLVGKMYGYRFTKFYCDVGTNERLAWAEENWPKASSWSDKEC